MTGALYIDGKDAYDTWGIFITEGGYKSFVSFAPMKKTQSNDWPEEDGEDIDLSEPTLDTREFAVPFASHKVKKTGAFIEWLSDKAYHEFKVTELDKTYRLRLVSQPAWSSHQRLDIFSLQLADDFPLEGYSYVAPQPMAMPETGYEVDGIDLARYGVSILQGSFDEITKSPSVKLNLLQNVSSLHGAIYDGEVVKFKSKDVKLSCLMQSTTLTEFWRNYNALLFDLVRPGERSLYVDSTGYEYPCYYKSCNVSEFYPTGKIRFKFDLTLVFTSFRVGADEYLLASEVGEWIMTEDGRFAIDIKPYTHTDYTLLMTEGGQWIITEDEKHIDITHG